MMMPSQTEETHFSLKTNNNSASYFRRIQVAITTIEDFNYQYGVQGKIELWWLETLPTSSKGAYSTTVQCTP